MKTIFELKQDIATIGQQIQKTNNEIVQRATAPETTTEELETLESTKQSLEKRMAILQGQLSQMEAEQKANLSKDAFSNSEDPKQNVIDAKAELIRQTIRGGKVNTDVLQALGDKPSTTNGDKFLPKTVANDIIAEPIIKNPLRQISTLTTITNLEIPKISFNIQTGADVAFIDDMATAKEIAATGDSVVFGRNKFKIWTGVSETILLGTNTNLVSTVEANLQSGIAYKEKMVAFASGSNIKTGEEHMSFYRTTGTAPIDVIQDPDLFVAIKKAIAALHEEYRENATIVMKYSDYMDIIEKLANGSTTLYGVQPEQVLGKPVVFCDAAEKPIIGDFSYSHFNYDIGSLYETDKDVKTGINLFVVTAWFDHQIKLSSAFRIAEKK